MHCIFSTMTNPLKSALVTHEKNLYTDMSHHHSNRFTSSKAFRDKVKRIFDDIDFDRSGSLNELEFYAGVMAMHVWVAQYTVLAAKTVPTREDINRLFRLIDVDSSGTLDYDEFTGVVVVMFQSVAMRVTTQIIIKLILAPFFGAILVEICIGAFKDVIDVYIDKVVALLPSLMLILNKTTGIAVGAAIVNTILLPYVIDLMDRAFLLQVENENLKNKIDTLESSSAQRGSGREGVVHDADNEEVKRVMRIVRRESLSSNGRIRTSIAEKVKSR